MITTYLKGHISRKNESFTLIWLTLNMETGFSLHLREAIPKNGHTFCLDKCLPCYIMIDMFVMVNCYVMVDWLIKAFTPSFLSLLKIRIRCFEYNILIQIQNSILEIHAVILNAW